MRAATFLLKKDSLLTSQFNALASSVDQSYLVYLMSFLEIVANSLFPFFLGAMCHTEYPHGQRLRRKFSE